MMWSPSVDKHFMTLAIKLARGAAQRGDRPFGCVIASPEYVTIGVGAGTEGKYDTTRHSETVAIRNAEIGRQNRLEGCTLYSTHEPCIMCAGAIVHAHISRVVWGSARSDLPTLFHQRSIRVEDVLEDTSDRRIAYSRLLQDECIALFDQELIT
jgi:tRNA(Arg) A34 adenosine deaminase TadA